MSVCFTATIIGAYYGACHLAHTLAEARGLELVSEISVFRASGSILCVAFCQGDAIQVIARMPIADTSQNEHCIQAAKEQGINVIVSTAACLRKTAKQYGIEIILIEVEEESLSRAIDSAVALAEVNAEAERFRNYINNEDDAIFSVDSSGVIRIFNPAMSRIAEIATEDVIGVSFVQAVRSNQMLHHIHQQRRVFEYRKNQYLAISFEIKTQGGSEQAFKGVQIENTLALTYELCKHGRQSTNTEHAPHGTGL